MLSIHTERDYDLDQNIATNSYFVCDRKSILFTYGLGAPVCIVKSGWDVIFRQAVL